MFKDTKAYSGFSVNDLSRAKEFYSQVLGVETEDGGPGFLLKIAGNNPILVYPKDDHAPATYTILNFPVEDIDVAVGQLVSKGVSFEHYEGMTDEQGIARGLSVGQGPNIAWFKDPAGNILSVLQEK